MTGHALAGVRDSCLAGGMNGFVAKPISLNDVRSAIIDAIGGAQVSISIDSDTHRVSGIELIRTLGFYQIGRWARGGACCERQH